MSAIAGYWGSEAQTEHAASCGRMIEALRAYGPDDQKVWASGDLAFGRALFRMVPEDIHDRQPLAPAGGRFVIVADIRIDNREDLLSRLGRPQAEWRTLSDSDVLLAAVEQWGERVFDLLVGDYAVAIWDRIDRHLLLARDPTGERSLFYHQSKGLFAFASMPKGLHALREVPRRPDEQATARFLGLLPEMGSACYYSGIEQLAPGHVLTVTQQAVRVRRYWNPEPQSLGFKSFDEYRDAFRAQLDQAVQSRLRGVGSRVASHLSAGWDSGSVTATAARLLEPKGARVDAFTARPDKASRDLTVAGRIPDEAPIAATVAAMHPNVDHQLIEITGRSLFGDLDRYVELFDRPIYDPTNHLWMSAIRSAAKTHGDKILLTGEMGNFTVSSAPYTILADLVRQRRWRDWLREAHRIAKAGDARYRGIAASSFGPWVPERVWTLVRRFSSRPEVAAYTATHPSREAELARAREALGVGLASRSKHYVRRTVRAIGFYDTAMYRKGANAGWRLDERDPTADRRLIEFCLSLPLEMLLKDGVRRPLARAALSDRLPAAVLDEKRKGLQGADWYLSMARDLPTIQALLEEMAANDLASSLIDIPRLHDWIREWPTSGWEQTAVMARYRGAMSSAISAGHFILHASR